jgi:transcriptional regulator with XRE-family HTH domain
VTSEELSTPGRRMRFLRQAKGWDQTSFARRIHTSQPAISQWELDKWLPGPEMRRRIAEELGATQSFIFDQPEAAKVG